jgi:outer membrane receptor protein involved in Fe transport
MKTPIHYPFASALALTLGLTAPLPAQTAPSASAPDDQPIVLAPFTVNTERDNGYTAVDSLAGGRMATPIRVTPSSVSSLTRQFIDDLALTNIQDALKWSLNVVPTSFRNGMSGASGGDVFNFWSVSIRGDNHVQGGNPPTKNYFPTFMMIDTYNVDRLETDGGPNSILFGIGDIGGTMTAYTKTALFDRDFSRLSLSAYSYHGGYRSTVDVNQSVGKHFALRLNALYANEKGWKDGDIHKKKGVDLAGTYKFTESTQVRFEVEGWKEEKSVFAQSIQDGTSLWNKATNAATWGAVIPNSGANPVTNPGAPGVTTMSAWGGPANYQVYTPGVGLLNWAGGTRSMGTGDAYWGAYLRPTSFVFGPSGTTIMALPSRHFAITPADGLLKPEALSGTLNFEHRFNDNFDLLVSGYRYVDDAKAKNFEGAGGGQGTGVNYDLNKQLPDGSANPNYGKLYSDFFLDAQTQNHRVSEVRGQLSYHFDAHAWNIPIKQLFSASGGEQVTNYDARQYQATVMNGYDPNNWTQNMVWGRIYWDNPHASITPPASINGKTVAYIPLPFNWYDFNSKQTIKYYGAFSQTRLWDDRLNVSLGIRHDSYENWKVGLRGPSNTPTLANGSGNTYSAGVVGYITDWLGVVGNVSENYQPAAGGLAPSVFGETFGPSFGKLKEAGLRISTKDGKYFASLKWYNQTAHDIIGGDSPDFQGIWNDYFAAGGTNTDIGPAGVVTGGAGTYHANMSYVDTYDVKYTGYELEATASPTKNFRVQFHYSKPKGEKTNDGPNARAYFAQKLPTWQAIASGSSAAAQKVASDLTNAQNMLTSTATPVITGHLVKEMYNVFAAYSFTDGALKGFELGAGATHLGEQYGNPWDTVNGQRALSPGYTTYSALLAYSTTFSTMDQKVHARFQVNVDNLFGKDTLVFLNYQTYGSNQIQAMDYNLLAPRKFTFTANFEF